MERVDDAGFTRLQFQPSTFEFLRDESLAVLSSLSVGVENHQLLGVAAHRRRGLLVGKRPVDALLQTVSGKVGQQGGAGTTVGSSFLRRAPFPLVHAPRLQPRPDLASAQRAGVHLLEYGIVVDALEACGAVGLQDPFGFLVAENLERTNCLPRGASRSTAIAGGLKPGFPFGLSGPLDHGLACPLLKGRDPQGPGLRCPRFGNPHPTDRLGYRGAAQRGGHV